MRFRPFRFVVILVFAAGSSVTARAQSSSTSTTAAPDGSASATNGSSDAPAAPAAKKVWTNDDVSGLRGNSPISTVGNSNSKPDAKPAPAAKNGNARSYQARIAKLEAQIPPLDSQIAELQAAIEGKPTGDGKSSQRPRGVKADDWSVEMQQLQTKRQGILDQISALKDEARHHGVNPNALP